MDTVIEFLADGTPTVDGEVPRYSIGQSYVKEGEMFTHLIPENRAAKVLSSLPAEGIGSLGQLRELHASRIN
jgi:hypothetical protein